jgi:hypothetical protein
MARQELASFLRDRREALRPEALLGDLRARPNLARRRFLRREEVLTTGHEDFAEIAVARLRAAAREASLVSWSAPAAI